MFWAVRLFFMGTDCGYMATYGKRLDFFLKEVFNQHQRTNNRQLYGCYISLFVLKAKKSKVIIIDYKNTFKKSIDRKWKLSCMNFPMTNMISLTGHATEFWYVGFLWLSARGILGWNWRDRTGRILSAGAPVVPL